MANSKLARSLRVKLQLRDKKGRWIEMGRGGKWFSSLDGSMKSGIVIGSKGNNAIIREKNADGTLGSQNVEVPMNTLEMIPSKASLDPQTLQLMNEYKQGQSSKGKKESDAREKALSDAMAAESNGQAVQDEVEVEYAATVEEELEDLLDEAPQGALLLKNNKSGQHTFKKNADGSWSDGVSEPTSSNLLANDPGIKEYQYVGTGDTAKKTNELLGELANGPVKEKKGWFGKKKKKDDGVDPFNATLDSIIQSTNEMLGLPNNNQNQKQETAAPAAPAPATEAVEEHTTPEAVEEAPSADAPIDISAWKYHQGTQGGSNPGGVYTDTEGNDHYVKKSKSDMHAKNEVLADKFYEKLGVKTSKLKLADVGNGKLGTASEMVPGSKNDFYSKANSDEAYKKKFQEDFAIDAWLANWDVVGLEYDNALTDANGDPIRIDPGGALLYRAMGSPKGDMFGPEVGEWDSMRKGNNPASKIFGSMSDEDLKNSVAKLKNITDEDVAAIVDSMEFDQDVSDYLKNTLSARKQNLLNKFPELANEEQTDDVVPSPEEAVDAPNEVVPEAPEQTAKPEPIETEQVVGTDTPFIATPEEAPAQSPKEIFKAKKETYRAAALAGEKLDFSDIPSQIPNGDNHFEDYWEDSDETTPDFAGHFEAYTIAEAEALTEYVSGSDEINGMLRGNKGVYNHLNEEDFEMNAAAINKLDDVIAKSVVQQDTTVYRGIAMRQSTLDSFLENGAYEDLAYSSTSKEYFLANSWSAVDPNIDPDRLQVVLEMKLPAGFNAHKVDYLATGTKSYANEKEVILPRGTKFAIVSTDMGTEPAEGKAKSVVLTVTPILNDSNYKPEGIKNGQGSNNTAESGDGDSTGSNDSTGESVSNDSSGGGYENPSEGAGTDGEGSESSPEGVQEPEVAPAANNLTPAGNDMGEEIPVINGAKAMLSQMAKKQGISVDQLQKELGLPADGAFPNKGKTVTNDNGDVFEANSIVSNPKFGEGIASIILPSTNSVKVLYADHGFKVTQAKNLSLVSGTAPQEVAAQALDLNGAVPGDVGINPANGKMYFVDKNGNAMYAGDEVEYTKKGVTQHGKVSSIYKGTKTAKVEWDDDTASVKKASQLIGKQDNSSAPVSDETENTPEETISEPAEQTPEAAPEAVTPVEDSPTPAPVEEPVAEAPEAAENKGWTPAEGYDPMGPTKIQIHPDMKTAIVYPHDNSEVDKNAYNLTNKVGYNSTEEKFFGTGHNLQPLYEGDKVEYLFNGKQYSGEIIEVKPKAQSAVVLLDDGTKKLKKFSQLSGNYPKQVDVDENGNYTDWNGNAAQIPNFKGTVDPSSEETTPEEALPETSQVAKPEWGEIVTGQIGQSLRIDGDTYVRIGGNYQGSWMNTKNNIILSSASIFNAYNDAENVSLSEAPITNISPEQMNDLGNKAKISSKKLGISLTKDADNDWYSHHIGYVQSDNIGDKVASDDWEIDFAGNVDPDISVNDLQEKEAGQILTMGDHTYYKAGDSDQWWSPSDSLLYGSEDIYNMMSEMGPDKSVRFGDKLSSNLSGDELSDLKKDAEVYSEKLNVTLEKDSDGDWTSYGFGYFTDDVLDYIVADDWVIQSTGQVDPNLSTYDLDSANSYSELYSSELDESFNKEAGDSVWVSNNTGNAYSAEELLETFPTDDWSLSEAEIDDDYMYGMGESDLSDLNPGSKVSHTASTHETPDTYIKIGDNHWVETDNFDDPNLNGPKHTDDSFEDGYTWVSHSEEGEYEVPEFLNIEPNTPNIAAEDVSLEWLESTPTGTAIKSSMSSKWTYIKNDEGMWSTTDQFGKATGAKGTSEQVLSASQYKYDIVDIFVPETEKTETAIADLEVGTFFPHEGLEGTGFIKVGDNQWKMKSSGQEVDHILNDDFITAFQKTTNSVPVTPTPAPTIEDNADSGPMPDIIKPSTPDVAPMEDDSTSEPLPDIVKPSIDSVSPETSDTDSLPTISGMTPDEFNALSVGTKLINTDNNYTYEKVSDTEWVSYITGTSEDNHAASFTSDIFHGILHMPSIAENFKIQAAAAKEEAVKYPENTKELSFEDFKELPIGSALTAPWSEHLGYTKTGDNQWLSAVSGGHLVDSDFDLYIGDSNDSFFKLSVPEQSDASDSNTIAEEIENAPVGSTIKYAVSQETLTKQPHGLWESSISDEPDSSSDDIIKMVNVLSSDSYEFTPGTGEVSKPKYPETVAGFETVEEFDALPIGSTIGSDTVPDIYTKTGINEWSTKNVSTKKTDNTFHYLITTGTGGSYKIAVPEDGVPVAPTTSDTSATAKEMFGMSVEELKDAPKGSTITYTGSEYYNMGSVLTKNADGWLGEWESNTAGTPNDTSDALEFFTQDPDIGSNWMFQKAGEPASEKTLKDITESEFVNLPTGTKLTNNTTQITKQADGGWSGKWTTFTHETIAGLYSDKETNDQWVISPPDAASEILAGSHKSVKLSQNGADNYPTGTVIKKEVPSYYGNASELYYVKMEDGTWQSYKQTAKTLSAKQSYTSSMFNNWSSYTWAVGVPKSGDHFVSHTGELGYVGDYVQHDGATYKVSKIMKTGVKLTDGTNSITVKPQKLQIDSSTFGWKENQTSQQSQPSAASTSTSPSEPVDLGYDINASNDFAGASAEKYNEQGLSMGHIENPKITPAFTLSPSHEPDLNNPLYGTPQPEEPAKPNAYPAFTAPKLELPKWSSEAWLAKVEQRYLDNPNKAKSSLQESNKWTAVQSVMNGEKNNLDSLLSSKYLDQDLYNEAMTGIDDQVMKNQPLIEEHEEFVAAAQSKYDSDKAMHLSSYTELKSKYDADLLAWMSANPDPDAMKPLIKPKVSSENFTGGAADWNKSHIGTHTAEAVFSAIKSDNVLGKHGLSIATDADKVEGLDVNVTKTLTSSGDEVLDLRFKVTQAHGKIMDSWAKKLTGVKKTTTIHPPNMKLDTKTGLLKDTGSTGQGTDSGSRYEITHEDTGAKIIFQRDNADKAFNNNTNHNSVRVIMPLNSTPEQYQQVLDFMGIEGKPASEGDIRVLAENKLIGLMGDGVDAIGAGNLKGETRKKALESIKAEFGVSPEDVVFQADVNGRVRLFFNDKATKKLASKLSSSVKTFNHNLSSASDVDTMMNILTGPHPGLLSTYHRWSNGMSQQGMSSSQDMKYGSGDYIYTTPSSQLYVSGNNVAIHPEAMFRKLDAWANNSDSYGKKNSDGYDMGAFKKLLKKNGSLHEYLPTDSVSINDIHFISVYSGIREDLIKRLKAKGILKINGFNIEDFIISQGMKPQEADYIPGIGVVPAGTTWDPSLGGLDPVGDLGGEAVGVGGPAV